MTRIKDIGFPVTRKRESRRDLPRWLLPLALLALLWLLGLTRAWPQSSDSLLNSSGNDLKTWETLSGQFQTALSGQSERLRQALKELETSKASSLKLTGLLEQSLKANDSLKNYNEQIGQRMQRRDEDLAAAYADIDRLQKQQRRLILAVVILGGIIAGYVAIKFLP